MWEKGLICKFCRNDFIITELDVKYDDLRDPIFFVPDYQYFVVCPQCDGILIQSDIPPSTAVDIQDRIHAESNESSDNQ